MFLRPSPFLLLTLGIVWLSACQPTTRREQTQRTTPDSLQIQLTALNDSVYRHWHEMMAADDLKLRYVQRLLQEISYNDWNLPALNDSLQQLRKSVLSQRYRHPKTITSAQIDAYDAATDGLLRRLTTFTQLPNFKTCALCNELVADIQRMDGETVLYRLHYDEQAKAYNAFIRTHKAEMVSRHAAYDTLNRLPLFQLVQ